MKLSAFNVFGKSKSEEPKPTKSTNAPEPESDLPSIELLKEFCDAAKNGDLSKVTSLLEQDQDLVKFDYLNPTYPAKTAIDLAAISGKLEVVQFLLKNGAHLYSGGGGAGAASDSWYAIPSQNEVVELIRQWVLSRKETSELFRRVKDPAEVNNEYIVSKMFIVESEESTALQHRSGSYVTYDRIANVQEETQKYLKKLFIQKYPIRSIGPNTNYYFAKKNQPHYFIFKYGFNVDPSTVLPDCPLQINQLPPKKFAAVMFKGQYSHISFGFNSLIKQLEKNGLKMKDTEAREIMHFHVSSEYLHNLVEIQIEVE